MTTIEELLNQHEGKTLEFKQGLSSPKPLLKTLVAFVNTAGGILVLCVDDKKYDYPLPKWYEAGPYTDLVFSPLVIEKIHNIQKLPGPKSRLGRDQVKNPSFID